MFHHYNFINQEKRIPLLQIDKNGTVQADMRTVDPFYIYGNINKINPKAKQISDLSKEELNGYMSSLKDQWTDSATKFLTEMTDKKTGEKVFSEEEISDYVDMLHLPVEETSTKYRFQKGGPVYGKYAKQIAGIS